MSSKLSRRDFLKGTLAGAGALAATTVLGGCSNEACPEVEEKPSVETSNVPHWLGTEPEINDISETWETDTVIVGAGNGGLACAAYAAKLGLQFRIIQNTSVIGDTRH